MEAVWQIVALGLLGAVLAALLKKHTPELALLLAVAVCGAAALAAARGVREVWAFLEDLLAAVEISSTLFLPLLKTAGIAVVTRIGADLCRDAGESAVASAVEMAGAMGALLAVLILGVVLLCGAADAVLRTPESPMRRFLPMAGAAAIAVLSLGSMKSLLGLGTQTIEELDVFSKALLPTLAAAVAAGGGAVTAGTGQVIAVCFADALITLIRGLLLPMTYFLAAAATADAMLPRHGLGTVAKAASRVVTWLLTGSLVLFTGYLTLSGAVSTSADALTVQMTRSAVGAMPVVGRILSDAAGSVLAGAGVVKNAIGVFGLLGVLAACLGPFVRLGVQYLLYKLTAFLAGMTAAPELAKLIDALGGVFGLMLGMTGSCALLLLISISSAILVVTP